MKGVKYVVVFLLLWVRLPNGLTKEENSGEAEIFCQLRLLAENDPEKLVFGNEEREKQIMRQIEKVGPEIRGLSGQAHTREVSLIAQFHAIAQEAQKLMGAISDRRRKAIEKRLSAKRHLHQVIFGDYGGDEAGELGPAAETIGKIFSGNTFQESCGGKGDKPAGKSLINDFICLCAQRLNPGSTESICKYKVDTAVESDFKNWTAVWHNNNHQICVNTPPLTPTPQNIHKLVALFERAVGREQSGSQVKGIFGYVSNENKDKADCNAKETGKTCVNYEHALKNGGIEWVNHLKNASQDLQDMGRYAEESENTLPQLEMLEYNALLLYEEAKYSAHLPHVNTAPNTNSSNESYEESSPNSTNASQEGEFEEEDNEENKDTTWKGRPSLWGFVFFLMAF